jgi:hypothetical protein
MKKMCLIKRGLKSAEVYACVFVCGFGFGGILKLIDIEGVNSIAAHKASDLDKNKFSDS